MKQLMPSGFRSKERMPARLTAAAIALCLPIFLGGCQFLEPIADDADSGAFDPRKVLAVSFLVGGGLFLKSGGSSNSSTSTTTGNDDGGMMQPLPSFDCTQCGSADARQVDYVAGTSLATYTFDPVANTETNRVDLTAEANVRRDGLPISTLIPAALSDGDLTNGEIPQLNVDAYANDPDPADATQRNLAVVFEMEYGALGLWMVNPGTFFLGGTSDPGGIAGSVYTRGDFTSAVFFDYFGMETDAANIPTTGTANFDGVIYGIAHSTGFQTAGSGTRIPPNSIFVASQSFTMQADFTAGARALTSPNRRLLFNRQYYGPGNADDVLTMLAADPGALLEGKEYSPDVGATFGGTGGAFSGLPLDVLFRNGMITGNEFQLGVLEEATPACCLVLNRATPLVISGKFYGPTAQEAIGSGRQIQGNNEIILGIFTRQRE